MVIKIILNMNWINLGRKSRRSRPNLWKMSKTILNIKISLCIKTTCSIVINILNYEGKSRKNSNNSSQFYEKNRKSDKSQSISQKSQNPNIQIKSNINLKQKILKKLKKMKWMTKTKDWRRLNPRNNFSTRRPRKKTRSHLLKLRMK